MYVQNERICDIGRRGQNNYNLLITEGIGKDVKRSAVSGRTVPMKYSNSPGRGDFPVGQFEAQKRYPNGIGIPSFASSVFFGHKSESLCHITFITGNVTDLDRLYMH